MTRSCFAYVSSSSAISACVLVFTTLSFLGIWRIHSGIHEVRIFDLVMGANLLLDLCHRSLVICIDGDERDLVVVGEYDLNHLEHALLTVLDDRSVDDLGQHLEDLVGDHAEDEKLPAVHD